ncbi:MAG: PEP-CTERM sorting domain-containing protein [Fimbriimonadaceae bacterium]|nr:PEP-CTERM sorting domain-containing protein [Fimbriimonadaceae bacterium]
MSVLAVAFAAQASATELVVNGGFEDQPNWNGGISHDGSYTAFTGADIPGWTIADGHAATIHNHGYPYISGTYSLNTDGEGYNGHNVDIYQDVTPGLGSQNTLSFSWKIWYENDVPKLDVSLTDLVTLNTIYHGNFGQPDSDVHNESFNFVGTGNALRLEIKESPETGYNDNAFIVDDFSIRTESVPEPFTLAGLTLAGVFAARRRKA